MLSLTLFTFLLAPAAFRAQQTMTAPEKLPLSERVWIATQIYSSIETYFGHWRGVPDLDLDKEFKSYVDQVIANDDRRAFDLASMELLAKLNNGHSGFGDAWLRLTDGQRLGFYAYPIDGQWVVTQSSNRSLKPGDVIVRIDEESFEGFFRARRKYVSASDERWARRAFFEYPYLFPKSFTLALADGRKVSIVREGEFRWPGSEHTDITVREEDGVAYIRIPSFSEPKFENAAIKAVQNLSKTKAIILDVRANHGGSSPVKLLEALMDRPYRWWSESTPVSIGVFKYRGTLGEHSEVYWSGGVQKPSAKGYRGPLYILVDGGCFSACEDFVVPFKDNHRATIIGERTAGSSGQPFGKEFDNGMGFGLSTKREFFPDGSEFEGVGIEPDIEVHTKASDLQTGMDSVLEKAHELISALGQGAPSPANSVAPTSPVLHFTSQLTSRELPLSPASVGKQYLERLWREYRLNELVVGLGSDFDCIQDC